VRTGEGDTSTLGQPNSLPLSLLFLSLSSPSLAGLERGSREAGRPDGEDGRDGGEVAVMLPERAEEATDRVGARETIAMAAAGGEGGSCRGAPVRPYHPAAGR
jgi:hypothetical protein